MGISVLCQTIYLLHLLHYGQLHMLSDIGLCFVFSSCAAICNEKSVVTVRYKVGMMLSLVQRVWCHGTFNRHNFCHVVDSFYDISRRTASILSPSVSLSLH